MDSEQNMYQAILLDFQIRLDSQWFDSWAGQLAGVSISRTPNS